MQVENTAGEVYRSALAQTIFLLLSSIAELLEICTKDILHKP
jgi:hypothetical protein